MSIAEIVGAFAWGFTVMVLIGIGLSSAQSAQVKIFTAITASMIGGAAMLLLASMRGVAGGWPEEFWAYPVGLIVGLPVCAVYWETSEGNDEFKFRLSIAFLAAGSVVLLWSPGFLPFIFPSIVFPDTLKDILRALGEALLVAADRRGLQ